MYKPQYLNIVRATKSAYGNNIAYFKRRLLLMMDISGERQ